MLDESIVKKLLPVELKELTSFDFCNDKEFIIKAVVYDKNNEIELEMFEYLARYIRNCTKDELKTLILNITAKPVLIISDKIILKVVINGGLVPTTNTCYNQINIPVCKYYEVFAEGMAYLINNPLDYGMV